MPHLEIGFGERGAGCDEQAADGAALVPRRLVQRRLTSAITTCRRSVQHVTPAGQVLGSKVVSVHSDTVPD